MPYKIYFMGKDGKEKKIEEDSYNTIRMIHQNIKYQQHLKVTNIIKPNVSHPWLANFKDVVTFKNKKKKEGEL